MAKQKTSMIVYVAGGNVQSVMCSDPNVAVEVFDVDNINEDPEYLSADGESPDIDALWTDKTKGLTEVY